MAECDRGLRRQLRIWAVAALATLSAGLLGSDPCAGAEGARTYVFTPVAFLGDPAPGPKGGIFVNDFEPNGVNDDGDILFGADVDTGGEGVFLRHKGRITELVRTGEDAPGGGVFDSLFLGGGALNDEGDVALDFTLSPFSFPVGVNSGAYRFSHRTGRVTAVVVPSSVTPAPRGARFAGTSFAPSLNEDGDLVFPGIVPTDRGIHLPDEAYTGLGQGLFKAGKKGRISSVVSPGDPAPGGGTFDFAAAPWINEEGAVAFNGHIAGEECHVPGFPPQATLIICLTDVFVKKAESGHIRVLARHGEPAPGGGVYRQAFGPVINDRGDVAFLGDLTSPPDAFEVMGVYLRTDGETISVAHPGDPMPGGGRFVTASSIINNQIHVNNRREVSFNAILDTDVNRDRVSDTGLFVRSHHSLQLVARTGTMIPDVGIVDRLVMGVTVVPPPPMLIPNAGAVNNDRGQVTFGATLADGRGVLLLATPNDREDDDEDDDEDDEAPEDD